MRPSKVNRALGLFLSRTSQCLTLVTMIRIPLDKNTKTFTSVFSSTLAMQQIPSLKNMGQDYWFRQKLWMKPKKKLSSFRSQQQCCACHLRQVYKMMQVKSLHHCPIFALCLCAKRDFSRTLDGECQQSLPSMKAVEIKRKHTQSHVATNSQNWPQRDHSNATGYKFSNQHLSSCIKCWTWKWNTRWGKIVIHCVSGCGVVISMKKFFHAKEKCSSIAMSNFQRQKLQTL